MGESHFNQKIKSHLHSLSLLPLVVENWAMVAADPNCFCVQSYGQQCGWMCKNLIGKIKSQLWECIEIKGQEGNSHLCSLSLLPFVVENRAMTAADPNCACVQSYDQQCGWV